MRTRHKVAITSILLIGISIVVYTGTSSLPSTSRGPLKKDTVSASAAPPSKKQLHPKTSNISARPADPASFFHASEKQGNTFFIGDGARLKSTLENADQLYSLAMDDKIMAEWHLGERNEQLRDKELFCEEKFSKQFDKKCIVNVNIAARRIDGETARVEYSDFQAEPEDDGCTA